MPDTLLATKLHIPRSRRDLVARPRLMEHLDAGLQGKLTIVSAPAGYGKTTTLTSWIDHTQIASGWLSLDEADNDLARFLTYLIAAIQRLDENIGLDVQSALSASQSAPVEALLSRLLNELENEMGEQRHGCRFILVLDDYHLIKARGVHDALNFLLDHMPSGMHLVVAGRSDPPVPISRLRVQRQLTEIRTPQLRFTKIEAAAFLNDLMALGSPVNARATQQAGICLSIFGFSPLRHRLPYGRSLIPSTPGGPGFLTPDIHTGSLLRLAL